MEVFKQREQPEITSVIHTGHLRRFDWWGSAMTSGQGPQRIRLCLPYLSVVVVLLERVTAVQTGKILIAGGRGDDVMIVECNSTLW